MFFFNNHFIFVLFIQRLTLSQRIKLNTTLIKKYPIDKEETYQVLLQLIFDHPALYLASTLFPESTIKK